MPDSSHIRRDTTLAAQFRQLSDALALAPDDAGDGLLLDLVARTLSFGAGGVLALLVRDATGTMQLAAVAPEGTDGAAALLSAGVYGADDLTDAVLQARTAAAGLHTASTVSLTGHDRDNAALVLFGRGAGPADPAPEQDDLLQVAGALLGAARDVRGGRRREAALRAQLEQSACDGRDLAHRLNNDLTLPVGVMELLLDRTSFAPDLRDLLQAAALDLAALERHIRSYHNTVRAQADAPLSH